MADKNPHENLRPLPQKERQSRRLRGLPPESPQKQISPQKQEPNSPQRPNSPIQAMNDQNQLNDVRRILQEVRDYQPVQVACRAVIMDGMNFPRWKRDMSLYLKETDLWETVTSPVPEDPDQAWRRKNNKALSDIHNTCKEEQQDLIMDAETAKEAWDILVTKYEAKTPGMVNRLLNEFSQTIKEKSETCTQYVTRVKGLARQLMAVGEKVSEERLLNKILQGLPKEYAQLRMTVALQNQVDQEKVIDAIVGEEKRISSERERAKEEEPRGRRQWSPRRIMPRRLSPRSASPASSTGIRCEICYKRGHDKMECWELRNCEVCGKRGHIKEVCWELYPEKRQPRDQRQEYRTSQSQLQGQNYRAPQRQEQPYRNVRQEQNYRTPQLRAQAAVQMTEQPKEQLQIEPAYPGAPSSN